MARSSRSKGGAQVGWLASLFGATFLVVAGFLLGLVVGVVKEQPELVVGHLAGRSEEVPWTVDDSEYGLAPSEFGTAPIDVAAGTRPLSGDGRDAESIVSLEELPPINSPSFRAREPEAFEPEQPRPQTSVAAAQPGRAVSELPEVSASAPKPAAAARNGGFSVQVGAFGDLDSARRVQDDLEDKGFHAYVPAGDPSKGKWRVRVGPVSTREEADRMAQRLKAEERLPTWVLSEGGG